MQTKPAIVPVQVPKILGLPRRYHSIEAQVTAPAAAEKCVAANTLEVNSSQASELPALKPSQPTHSIAAPMAVYVRL